MRGDRAADVAAAAAAAASAPNGVAATLGLAREWLTTGARAAAPSPLAEAVFVGDRSAPPQLVPLTHGMQVEPEPAVNVPAAPGAQEPPPIDTTASPPRLEALLTGVPASAAAQARDVFGGGRTTVGEPGAGAPRATPRRLADARAAVDPLIATRLVTAAPAVTARDNRAAGTVVAGGRLPATGRAGSGSELRRRPGLPSWQRKRVASMQRSLRGDGMVLRSGDIAVLGFADALRDVRARRPALEVGGDLPVRVLALDVAGTVTGDRMLDPGGGSDGKLTVAVPRRTARIVAIGGAGPAGGPGGAPGWHAATMLVQVAPRTLIGAGCTVLSSALATTAGTRRAGQRVATAFVTASDAVRGYGIVTTRLPAGLTAVALVLEAAERVDDARADDLQLGLTGAARARDAAGVDIPPQIVVSGSRTIVVYALVPSTLSPGLGGDPAAGAREPMPVEVTVASGEHVHLSGVGGGLTGAETLVEALRGADLDRVVAPLVAGGSGLARLAWRAARGAEGLAHAPATTGLTEGIADG